MSGPLRVAFFFVSFAPSVNGVVTVYRHVLEHLRKRDAALLLFVPPGSVSTWPGAEVIVCPGFAIPGAAGYSVPFPPRDLDAALARFRPDVVHVVDPFGLNPLGILAIESARRMRIPLVVGYHTHYPLYARAYGTPFGEDLLTRMLADQCARADLVLAPTSFIRDLLAAHGVDRVALWPGGVDIECFHPSAASPALRERILAHATHVTGVRPRFVVASTARLYPEKNLAFLCRLLSGQHDFALAVAGDGPERAALEALLPSATFLGNLPHRELASLAASADVVAVPSLTEVQGLVASEALACGTPAVVARAGGLPEAIEQGVTGEAVEPGSAAAFLRALHRWAGAGPETARACRAKGTQLTWEPLLASLVDHYHDLAQRGRIDRPARRMGMGDVVPRLLGAYGTFAFRTHPIAFHAALWQPALERWTGARRRLRARRSSHDD